jgi:hypothetical protein
LANDATDAEFDDISEGADVAKEAGKAVVDEAANIAVPAVTAEIPED